MKPYFEDETTTIYLGDCREVLPQLVDVDAVVTDPPYGDTSLAWDVPVAEWSSLVAAPQLWCFGSMRAWLRDGQDFAAAGWTYGQEIVWEKHNGSSFHADRFKRVHELAVHWYRGVWGDLHLDVPVTMDAAPRTIRRKRRTPHTGHIEKSAYASEDGGPKLMRSVQQVRSCHGYAEHPTQKPTGILRPLISYSAPPRWRRLGSVHGIRLDACCGGGAQAPRDRDREGRELLRDRCAAARAGDA